MELELSRAAIPETKIEKNSIIEYSKSRMYFIDPIFRPNARRERKIGGTHRTKTYFSNPTLAPESPISLFHLLGLLALADFAPFPRLKQWYFCETLVGDYSCGFSSGLKPDSLPFYEDEQVCIPEFRSGTQRAREFYEKGRKDSTRDTASHRSFYG